MGFWANQIKMKDCCKCTSRIDRDLATLSIQVHKGHLYQRGWRTQQGKASLRENLASVLLQTANWNPNQTLLDPFCGSGTIAIEAARFKMGLPTRIFQSGVGINGSPLFIKTIYLPLPVNMSHSVMEYLLLISISLPSMPV